MRSSKNKTPASLHWDLHATKPPVKITQQSFEGNGSHLRRLVKLKPGDRALPDDLSNYANDLLYTRIQSSLLVYLLPLCLEAWREDLQGNDAYGGFVEYFYQVLANRRIFEEHMDPKQAEVISDFMKDTVLEEIDEQRGLVHQGARAKPFRWICALTTYGVLRPDIDSLWTAWWSIETVGRAVAGIQYASCLMYPENENPIFAPWTRDKGGGPPCLWQFEGHLYENSWQSPNVQFLEKSLSVQTVGNFLRHCVERLAGQPETEMARQVESDFPILVNTVEARCTELLRLLQVKDMSSKPLRWSA